MAAKPKDPEAELHRLQLAVARARVRHEDLAERHRVLTANKMTTSANTLKPQMDRAFKEWQKAGNALIQHQKNDRGATP